MNLSNARLQLCSELGDAGFPLRLKPGAVIGRGFADVGYEAFVMLAGKRMLSLFTGDSTTFPEEHAQFFFSVPAAEELLDFLCEKGWSLSMDSTEEELYRIKLSAEEGRAPISFECSHFEEGLIEIAKEALRSQ